MELLARFRIFATATALAVLLTSPATPADEAAAKAAPAGAKRPDLTEALAELESIVQAIRKNLADQDRAWPNRERDVLQEAPAPTHVQLLQDAQRQLESRRGTLQRQVEWAITTDQSLHWLAAQPAHDAGPILDILSSSKDLELIDAVLPVIVKVGREDPRVFRAIAGLVKRLDPWPSQTVNSLSGLGTEAASLLLLDMGRDRRDLGILVAAAKSGDASVIKRLVEMAFGKDAALAAECRKALGRITPPEKIERRELESLLVAAIPKIRDLEVKVALIVYLGLFKNPSHAAFFESIYLSASEENVRVAALGGIGNAGKEGAGFLVEELEKDDNSLAIRRTCIHALGSLRHRPVVGKLIELLPDVQLGRDASRALARIAGEDLGARQGSWIRWWNQQPEQASAR